jgi:Ca2+-transporting ATPase
MQFNEMKKRFADMETRLARDINLDALPYLSEVEAEKRLKKEGYNELPSTKRRSIFAIVFEVLREPMFLLLIGCGTIYLVLGDISDSLMLLGFVFVIMGITFFQERKTERTLEALRDLSSPRALVIRDGEQKRIAGRDVVRGDIVVLSEGDRVPADAALLWSVSFNVDESLLTGESVPVRKVAGDPMSTMGRPGGDDLPFVFSGTLVVRGQGIAQVQATGLHTEIGKIGRALQSVPQEKTSLQEETGRLVRTLAILGVFLCALVVLIYGLTRGHWLHGILAGITLAMAMLPEEIPVVLTIFLALGAWRISQKRVLTRHVPIVESLGAATVLCVDKTGTLTLNSMSVAKIFAEGEFYNLNVHTQGLLPEAFHEIVEFSVLASQKDPFDPMEKALKSLGIHGLSRTEHLHDNWILVREYPLSQDLLALSHVWKSPDGKEYVIAAKGAPEAIVDLCHYGEAERQALFRHVRSMADEGLRVLGVAKARCTESALPGEQHDFTFDFVGLVGLADPLRPTVPDAIRECHEAGIRVVMITGDYPGTARYIARQSGLTANGEVITGPELDEMGDQELQQRIKATDIFARVVPEQKLRLVTALKANGEIVAMTGDGVNDAPALKAAHIGIAMGGRGTDVAREASSLVLLDDDFSSIVEAVKMGRRIFDNLKKAMAYIFAVHIPIAGMSLLPILFNWPLVFLPVHIVFLELIIDPACSVIFEAEREEADVMRRPPRDPRERLFNKLTIGVSLLQGLSVLLIVLAVFSMALYSGQGELEARALTFTTLIVANLGLILTNRSWSRIILNTLRSPNPALWWVVGSALAFLGLVLYVPLLRTVFHFTVLHVIDLATCLAAGFFSIMWFEALKIYRGRKNKYLHHKARFS